MARLWSMWAVGAKKFVLLGPVRTRAKKFAQRMKNVPKLAFYGVLGEFCRATGLMLLVLGQRCCATGVAGVPCDYAWARPGPPPTTRPEQVARYRPKRIALPRIMRGRAAT